MTSEFGDASEVLGNSHPVKLVRGVYVPHPVFRHYVLLVRYEIEEVENEIHLLLRIFEDIVCESESRKSSNPIFSLTIACARLRYSPFLQ